ncbi:hypothetical protein U8527_04400 [Kordia algicida OT-1]|uniref:Uncharacterized protein n=1 Tax=Kordia algicida OT-1 TaxID=391587 RepID=A9DPZ1_9FLAO|nr:hypothetical protein [Kordia algicida]EDP97563.1 hypothetical protein KAOT1_20412 [Kordia algicida OT-1]
MKYILKFLLCILLLGNTMAVFAQNDNYKLETKYMECMCNLFDDNGVEFKTLLKKAEQSLRSAELLPDTSGKSYITLHNNIRMAIDGRMANFGVSDYVIKALSGTENIKKYAACMNGILTDKNFENSKIGQIIALSTSGNNPKITELTDKMLKILEAKDFKHDFYKYLTFSLIDKYNTANKKQ